MQNNIDYLINITIQESKLSLDPNTKVGAILTNDNGIVISKGHNHLLDENKTKKFFTWNREGREIHKTKYPYVIHAEIACLLKIINKNLCKKYTTLITTLFPCSNCSKIIVFINSFSDNKIKEIIYLDDKYYNTDDHKASQLLLDFSGIKTTHYK